jgi:acyl-CoA synthetase (AMP-forming)/AMP-acid ligase II/acyl carrier protein
LVLNNNYVELQPDDRVLFGANPAFDAATFEVWGPLLNGACAVVVPKSIAFDPWGLAQLLEAEHATVMFITTALFNECVRTVPGMFARLRYLLYGGEACDARLVKHLISTGAPRALVHVYGPTESTTFATFHRIACVADGATSVPIGKPIANTQVYILDEHGEPVSIGCSGEIYIGGDGIAQGYLKRASLTAQGFVPDPFGSRYGARLYATGDRGRWLADGSVEFLGRRDGQVKIRGFRIELGDVEAALRQCPCVADAVVTVGGGEAGSDRRLIAYVSGAIGDSELGEVRDHLKASLPQYMLPAIIVPMERLPLTSNGKIDQRALPPPRAQVSSESESVSPRTPLEQTLAAVWCELLERDGVSVDDNFFDLGGHSLLATRVVARIRDQLAIELPVRALFTCPSIHELAAHIVQHILASVDPKAVRGYLQDARR